MSGAAPATQASVAALLGHDHRRLDAVLADVKQCLSRGEVERAAARFTVFSAGLDRHIEAEETILLPAFEQLTGATEGGPTHVMRAEHAEIRKLMAEVAEHLASASAADRTMPLAALTARLYAHNGKEERILYPATDQVVGDAAARDDLIRKLASF